VSGVRDYVASWTTRARQYQWDGCIDHDAYFWGRNPDESFISLISSVLYSGPCVQVPSGAYSIDWWTLPNGPNGYYRDGTTLCNSWAPTSKLSGLPCIIIHD
jgi:hypothetical protein